jgi:hypothetical protein
MQRIQPHLSAHDNNFAVDMQIPFSKAQKARNCLINFAKHSQRNYGHQKATTDSQVFTNDVEAMSY